MNPRTLQGQTLALITPLGLSTIRWRIYGFTNQSGNGRTLLVRSVDGKRESQIGLQELDALIQGHRLTIVENRHEPL